jgi:CDP-glucose 4,6-dehydratase
MATFLKSFAGKRILVTGHTGFKGSWLSEWLLALGADVWGFSLAPNTQPALFTQLGLKARLNHVQGDLRNPHAVKRAAEAARPDFVFHLAAQPIVRTAHVTPADTWATNVMGTVNLLEALRTQKEKCAVVVVTTDKVYGNGSLAHSEADRLDASDPYGASKAAVELAVNSWRTSFFPIARGAPRCFPNIALATARAGNVVGGGDWAKDRLLPDCVRSLTHRDVIIVRNPEAVRPWQHVLDPLAGYLMLAAELRKSLVAKNEGRLDDLSGPFNFGPARSDHRNVRELVETVIGYSPGKWKHLPDRNGPAENPDLRLDSRKAKRLLGWSPKWRFDRAIAETMEWYQGVHSRQRPREITIRQIDAFASHL